MGAETKVEFCHPDCRLASTHHSCIGTMNRMSSALETNRSIRLSRLTIWKRWKRVRFVENGRLQIPNGADVAAFLLSDEQRASNVRPTATLSMSQMFFQIFIALPDQTLADSTLSGMPRHQRHLERIPGKKFVVQRLTLDAVQIYVNKRAKENGNRWRTVWCSASETVRLAECVGLSRRFSRLRHWPR